MMEIENVSVHLPGFSLDNVSLNVDRADFFALLGPTGSGKSVLLEAIMGLIPLNAGHVRIFGDDISGLPPESRRLGLVYQDHALFPHMNVLENIVYGTRYHAIPDSVCQDRFQMLVDQLRLNRILDRSPTTLSGGEKQRTALARALMLNPRALLLDEPLSALDQVFRDDIRLLLKSLHAELSIPFILVSHSFSEVHTLANRGAVIRNGRLQQSGTIEELFERPLSSFVASFVGMKNVFPCRISNGSARVGDLTLQVGNGSSPADTHLALRPEEIGLVASNGSSYENILKARIKELDCQGFYFRVALQVQDSELQAFWTRQTVKEHDLHPGLEVSIGFSAQAAHTFAEPEPAAFNL